jgi:Ca2+:H+ antiporter
MPRRYSQLMQSCSITFHTHNRVLLFYECAQHNALHCPSPSPAALTSISTSKPLQTRLLACVCFSSPRSCVADLCLDAIRRQAYRVASAQAEDGAINYNPFARTRSRPIRNTTVDEVEHEAPSYIPPTRTRTGFARSSVIDEDNASLHIVNNSQDESGRLSLAMEQQDDTIQRISSHVDPPSFPTARMESKGFSITDEDVVARPGTTLDISKEERRKQMLSRSVPVGYQIRALLFYNYVATILLPCIPAGFAVKYAHTNTTAVFYINFAAIVPSATALSMVLKDLYIRSGDKVSALLNQTLR